MRATFGLGLVTIIGLAACSATDRAPFAPDGPVTAIQPTEPVDAGPDPDVPLIVPGIAITDLAVFQAVKVPIVTDGKPISRLHRNAPVVANRAGILRVYVKPGSEWKPRKLTAELRLLAEDGTTSPVVKETKTITGPSVEADPESTFNLEIPTKAFAKGAAYQVALTGDDGVAGTDDDNDGRFPRDGSFRDLSAEESAKLRVVVVPVKYDFDESGRLPATDDAQVALYKQTLLDLYPATDVEVTVHEPFPYAAQISGTNEHSFTAILEAMQSLRAADHVDDDVYYFGSFVPAETFSKFCPGGCIAGLGNVVSDAKPAALREAVGVGFAGQTAADTMAHELGHNHGRAHAPCGNPAGVDASFPYDGAFLGSWGYQTSTKKFLDPAVGHDMMAYCKDSWVSDYTYKALFDRISEISKSTAASGDFIGPVRTLPYRMASVDAAGNLTWKQDVEFSSELTGGSMHDARFFTAGGSLLATKTAHFFPYDHAGGGTLFVPHDPAASWKTVSVAGFNKLAR